MKHKHLAFTSVMSAVLCIISPISIPLGPIPFSLSIFAVFLISCISPPKRSITAVMIYILIGAAGAPVFSGFTGGFQQLTGITGGYIIGYIPCSFTVSYLTKKFGKSKLVFPLSMILGNLICCLSGTAWYSLQTGTNFAASLAVCVLPFIVGDAIKIAAASAMGIILSRRLNKFIQE